MKVLDPNGPSPYISLSNKQKTCEAKVYLFGAHVTSFQVNGEEKLWMSSLSKMDGSAAIRGGVPIGFPQFADEGEMKLHGFARESIWEVLEDKDDSLTLVLHDTDDTRKVWPHLFELRYTVQLLDQGIKLSLKVMNVGTNPFTFTGCFHTYFRFEDTTKISLHGFQNTKFIDKADGRKEKIQEGMVNISSEAKRSAKDANLKHDFVDRIYLDSPNSFEFKIEDQETASKTLYSIKQSNSWKDTTVYNPWLGDKQGPSYPDFDDDGYKYTICCEPTLSKVNQVTLESGEDWDGSQEILIPSE